MPNSPMPPPYDICASHAARLAAVEGRLTDADREKLAAATAEAWKRAEAATEGRTPRFGYRHRTQSAAPVNHVFPGRKPDMNHELDRQWNRIWRLEEAVRLRHDAMCEESRDVHVRMKGLEDQVQRLQRQVVSMACAATDDSDTHRQRIADIWSRIDALEQRAREQAADLAETREALKAAQRRLREMDEDSHGERG